MAKMRLLGMILALQLSSFAMAPEATPTLWTDWMIDHGFSVGMDLDSDKSGSYAWGPTCGFAIYPNYYTLYPGVQGRLYFSERSSSPVRLSADMHLGPLIGGQEKADSTTELALGAFSKFYICGDLMTDSNVTPIFYLGGHVDYHDSRTITALVLGAGVRF